MLYSLQPYLKYFALMGLVPWSEKCARYQFLQRIYSVFLILINVVMFIVSVAMPASDEQLLSLMVNVIVFVAKIVAMTVVLVQMTIQYDGYYQFCQELKYLGLRLQGELKIPLGGLSWKCYTKILGLGAICLVAVIPSAYVSFNVTLIYFWVSLLPVLVIRMQCVLLLLYVDLLGHHMRLLGNRLHDVLNCHMMDANCVLDGNCKQLCSLEFLLELKQSHMELYQLFTHFNDLFGWSILSIFVVLFLDSTINIYWTQQVLAEVYDNTYLIATISTFIPTFAILFALCRCGEFCRMQNMLIGSYVRGLTCHPTLQREPAYNDLLMEFTMQVEHNVLIINAEGFMNVDNSLLMSILAAKVTYLIVLMQFSSL
ncbi:putative gustatory receptor 39b [Drosophila serrata]|uniref:putative gustatory receptor 39b n=1 Tax=Drosophila serrata TaxID=7274 RepID=UPI000A1D0DFC|nr:putative gustatory receptor 39b [Drosophila serrata]